MTYLAKTAVKRVAPAALTEYVTVIPNVSTKLDSYLFIVMSSSPNRARARLLAEKSCNRGNSSFPVLPPFQNFKVLRSHGSESEHEHD